MLENTDRLLNRIRQNLQQTLIILGDRIDPLTTPPESLHRSTKLKARPNLLKAFTGTVSYTVSRCETTADMDEECQPIGLVEGREAAIRVLQEAALQKHGALVYNPIILTIASTGFWHIYRKTPARLATIKTSCCCPLIQ